MISSSVGSGHPSPDKSSCEIPHEYVSRQGNLSGKIISIKRNYQFNLRFFGKIVMSLLANVATFSEQLYFWINYFFTCLQRNYFDTTVTFSEQLFLQNSCFFEELLFWNSHFQAAVIFSEKLLLQSETSIEQPLLENKNFFRAVTFRNSYLSGGEIVQNKNIYSRATFSKMVLLYSIYFFRRATFWKELIFQESNIVHYLHFLEN